MDTKDIINNEEEVIEEIPETDTKEKIEENITLEQDTSLSDNDEESLNTEEELEETSNDSEEEYIYKKSKAPAITILSILLVIDVAALIIYLIGLDKVISFIK